eukprot:4874250-Amphidinium_carterae.1
MRWRATVQLHGVHPKPLTYKWFARTPQNLLWILVLIPVLAGLEADDNVLRLGTVTRQPVNINREVDVRRAHNQEVATAACKEACLSC